MVSDELWQRRFAVIEVHMNTEVTKQFGRTLGHVQLASPLGVLLDHQDR